MTDEQKKVVVDSNGCIWCWACVAICPEVFQFNDEGKSTIVRQPQNDEERENVNDATWWCCVWVIQIIEEEGEE